MVFPVPWGAAYGGLCRVLPRFHGAFIVRFTALSPSSQMSGDTVTFVNKDRMPGGVCRKGHSLLRRQVGCHCQVRHKPPLLRICL